MLGTRVAGGLARLPPPPPPGLARTEGIAAPFACACACEWVSAWVGVRVCVCVCVCVLRGWEGVYDIC